MAENTWVTWGEIILVPVNGVLAIMLVTGRVSPCIYPICFHGTGIFTYTFTIKKRGAKLLQTSEVEHLQLRWILSSL